MRPLLFFLSCFFLSAQAAFSQSISKQPEDQSFCPGEKDPNSTVIEANLSENYKSVKWEYRIGGDPNPWIEITDNLANSKNWEFYRLGNVSKVYFSWLGTSGVTLGITGYQFKCIFNGNISSRAATITVRYGTLSFTAQPTDRGACPGDEVVFSAPGSAECRSISYEWQVGRKNADGTDIGTPQKITAAGSSPEYSGFNTANLKVSKITAEHNGLHYRCVLSAANPVQGENPNSNWAKLTVVSVEPEITVNPTDRNICLNGEVSFGISANVGYCSGAYQWQQSTDAGTNWVDISNSGTAPEYKNAATPTLNLENVPAGYNNYQYRCKVTANTFTKYSGAATLRVVSPVITLASERTACVGGSATFEVSVTGVEASGYRWWTQLTNGQWWEIDRIVNNPAFDIPTAGGYESAALVVSNLADRFNGRIFRCEVTTNSACGKRNSGEARLVVSQPITLQPVAKNICPGSETVFEVTAASDVTAYQWQQRATAQAEWAPVPEAGTSPAYSGQTTASLKIANAETEHNNYQYRCQLTAGCGTAYTDLATLTVNSLPPITHPVAMTVCPGSPAAFQVSAGEDATAYQWQYRTAATAEWTLISQAGTSPEYSDYTSNHLKVNAIAATHNGYAYRCRLDSKLCSKLFSNPATLTVTSKPQIGDPANTKICLGTAAVFTVTAEAAGMSLQWQQWINDKAEWADISGPGSAPVYSGYTSHSLGVANASLAHSGRQYRCRITIENCGTTRTHPATLTVVAPPAITQPVAKNVCPGGETAFEVTAASGITAYQWQQRTSASARWDDISGTENAPKYKDPATSSLKVTNAAAEHNHYQYRCRLTAGCGTFFSDPAVLTVNTPPPITHPAAKRACLGGGTVFQVSAEGSDITAYQWQQRTSATAGWADISEAGNPGYSDFTTARLKCSTVTSALNGYEYRCRLTSTLCGGTIYSLPAALTVTQPVVEPLANQNVCPGKEAAFKVAATYSGCITGYKWQQRASAAAAWVDISGAETSPKYSGHTTNELKVSEVALAHNGYRYRCRLNLTSITQDTEPADLYVDPYLEIITHPKDSTVKEGNLRAAFLVKAKGNSLKYKWQVSTDQGKTWADIKETGTAPKYEDKSWEKEKLQVNDIPASANDYRYRCLMSATSCSGEAGEQTSRAAKLILDLSTAVEDRSPDEEVTLQVYPNPAARRVNVRLWHTARGRTIAALYNIAGQKVWSDYSMKIEETLIKEIPIDHLPNGLYLLKMVVGSEASVQAKVLVSH